MHTIRWGIIGVGNVTEVKSGPGFQKAENSALVAVMRRNGDLARDYAQRHNVPRWYDNAQYLIRDEAVDAIYIATPPHVHKEYTLMAAAAGKPIYCEKPMALTHADCQEMITACEDADVPLWVAYYRRAMAKFLKVKALVEGGTIGEIQTVTVRLHKRPMQIVDDQIPWRVQPAISGGGIFVDMGSHMLDLLDFLLGPIASAQGHATNRAGLYPAEDNVVASFTFESGVIGSGSWSFCADAEIDETILYGTKGQIAYSCFDEEPLILTRQGDTQCFEIPFSQHVQQPLIQTIVDELNGQGRCPSTGISAARTTQMMDCILADYRRKNRVR